MDALVQGRFLSPMNGFEFNHHSLSLHPNGRSQRNGYKSSHDVEDYPVLPDGSNPPDTPPSDRADSSEEGDYSDPILKYISQMLMEEEDLENKPCMFHDCLALQAAEKSFYDVLKEPRSNPPVGNQSLESPNGYFTYSSDSPSSNSSSAISYSGESNWIHDPGEFESLLLGSSELNYISEPILQPNLKQSLSSLDQFPDTIDLLDEDFLITHEILDSSSRSQSDLKLDADVLPNESLSKHHVNRKQKTTKTVREAEENARKLLLNEAREKKNHDREDSDAAEEHRSNKQLASFAEESESFEMYDNVLLCPKPALGLQDPDSAACDRVFQNTKTRFQLNELPKGPTRGRPRGSKKQGVRREVVDLRSLLIQCAQASANYDSRTATELLKQIRQHSSPYGDSIERLSHYFANALEARLAGTGTALYTAFNSKRISAADVIKAYKVYVEACPFKKMSNLFANRCICKVAEGATRIHIIDFGILYGFQWPCLIQSLSTRIGTVPQLRITGIDLPQPGLRPAERVEETGHRLRNYCQRFNVPFKYTAIAKKWENIELEDLNIDKDELLIVNCLNRLGNVPDETVVANSPRDSVLNLIRMINPDLFVHGVINGTYNTPFFVTRFREALFHFSSLFDMFEATVPREDEYRMLFEKEVFARDAMNVIACEGTERVERPETYKQWQVRTLRAGFRQLPLDQDVVKLVRNKVKMCYHKDFSVDEHGNWMLQGWKGRVLYALSCWKPAQQ